MTDVVVLGAGYAGVMAANRMAARGERVRLISPEAWFVERIRLHRVAAGVRTDARADLGDLVHPAVERLVDRATLIDAEGQTVALASGATVGYDTLVYAVGSGAAPETSAGEAAPRDVFSIADESGALALRAALTDRPEDLVTVVGAGLTGIELAAVLATRPGGVRVVTSSPMTERAAERAHVRRLRRLGVEVVTGERVDITTVSGLVVDTTGLRVPRLAARSGLPTDRAGRLVVGDDLTVPGIPSIIGAGDAAVVDTAGASHLRMACATALPMGAHAADVVASRGRGQDAPVFGLGYVVQCSDLGGPVGRIQLVAADDSERWFSVPGVLGGLLKEQVCRMTLVWLRQERRRAGRYTWRRPARAAAVDSAR